MYQQCYDKLAVCSADWACVQQAACPVGSSVLLPLKNSINSGTSKIMSDVVQSCTVLPLRIAAPYYAHYTKGMSYGEHVDDPIMGQGSELYRSDVSVTLFLNSPDDYDGGELVIQTSYGEQQVKLPAGDAVLYPSSSTHRVAEVSRGERLVAVSWIQSLVQEPEKRALLHDMNQARETLLREKPDAEETRQVNQSYVNLVRMWSVI